MILERAQFEIDINKLNLPRNTDSILKIMNFFINFFDYYIL